MNRFALRNSLVGVAVATGLLLLIPLVAMQFTPEVSWGLVDFAAAGGLLFSAGAAMVLAIKRFKRPGQRALMVGAIAIAVGTVWAELAVGIFR